MFQEADVSSCFHRSRHDHDTAGKYPSTHPPTHLPTPPTPVCTQTARGMHWFAPNGRAMPACTDPRKLQAIVGGAADQTVQFMQDTRKAVEGETTTTICIWAGSTKVGNKLTSRSINPNRVAHQTGDELQYSRGVLVLRCMIDVDAWKTRKGSIVSQRSRDLWGRGECFLGTPPHEGVECRPHGLTCTRHHRVNMKETDKTTARVPFVYQYAICSGPSHGNDKFRGLFARPGVQTT